MTSLLSICVLYTRQQSVRLASIINPPQTTTNQPTPNPVHPVHPCKSNTAALDNQHIRANINNVNNNHRRADGCGSLYPPPCRPREFRKTVKIATQETHSPRRHPASVKRSDETSAGTVRNERCYKVQPRRMKQAPQHEPDAGHPASKGWANVRESGRRRPSLATRARLQHQLGYNRAMVDGEPSVPRERTAVPLARGLATRADVGLKEGSIPKPRDRGDGPHTLSSRNGEDPTHGRTLQTALQNHS